MKLKLTLLSLVLSFYALTVFGQAPYLVKDIYSGINNSSPSSLLEFNGELYFQASNEFGKGLWKSDGKDSGTFMVKDINTGISQFGVSLYGVFNNMLYFTADDGIHGIEIWKTDGTDLGTNLVKDITPGNTATLPGFIKQLNNKLLFVNTNNFEESLWETNLTDSGTNMIKLIDTRTNFGLGSGSAYLNNYTYFWLYNSASEISELWKTNGTSLGTMVIDTIPGKANNITTFGNKIYFITSVNNTNNNSQGLYVSDGTNQGTQLLKSFNTFHQIVYDLSAKMLFEYNGNIFFVANDNTHGLELWKTDGTTNGTSLLKDINIGNGNGIDGRFYTHIAANGKLYFNAIDSSGMKSIWMTDGTTNGTYLLKNTYKGQPMIQDIKSFNNTLLYLVKNPSNNLEIWISDGIVGGQSLLLQTIPYVSNPGNIKLLGNTLFLTLDDPTRGNELHAIELSNGVLLSTATQKKTISVYPNPVSEKYIYLSNSIGNSIDYVIYDAFGHKFKENILIDGKIDVSEFPVGLYLLKTKDGIAKFVKQ